MNGQRGPKVSKTEGFNCWALFQVRKTTGLQVNSPLFQSLALAAPVVWEQEEAHLPEEATVPLLHKGKKNGIYPKYSTAW